MGKLGGHKDAVRYMGWLVDLRFKQQHKMGDNAKNVSPLHIRELAHVAKVAEEEDRVSMLPELAKQVQALLEKITSTLKSEPEVWDVFAGFNEILGRYKDVMDTRMRQFRAASSDVNWMKDEAKIKTVLDAASALLDSVNFKESKREVENLHDLKRENDDLHDTLSHKDSILEDYTLRMKTLETELSVLRNESKQDQQLLKANKSTVDSLKTHNSELMQLIQSLQLEKQKMAEENHHLIKSLEQTEAKFHSQERGLMETIVNLREKANLSISEKNSEVNALRSHLDTAQSKWEVHQAEMSQKMQQLEEQKQAVEAELNKTKSHSAQTIQSLQDLLQSRENDLQSANVTITELRSKWATTDITHNHLKSEYESCNALLSKAQTSLLEYQGEYQKVEKAFNERSSECDELRQQLATVTEDLRLAQDKYQQARQDGKAKDDDIASLRRQVTAFDQLVNTLKESAREEIYSQKEQLESTIEIYIGQLKMHETDMLAQATKLREAQEEVRQLRERISTKEQEAQQLHGMVEALKGSLQEEMDQKRQLQSEMDAYVASKASEWTAVEESLSRELEQSKRKCEELDAVRCLLEDQMQSQKDDYATALTAKDEELQTMHSRLAELQATATAKAQAIETLQLELAATRSALAELRLERESSELKTMMQKNDLETKLSETQSRCMDLEAKLLSHTNEAISVAQQLRENEALLALETEEKRSLDELLMAKDAEAASIRMEMTSVMEEAQQLRQEIAACKASIALLTEEKTQLSDQCHRHAEDITVLQTKLASADHKGRMLEEQIRAMKERVLQYEELEQLTSASASSSSPEDAVVQELTMVEQAIMSARSHEGELRQVVKESETIIQLLNTQVKEYQQEIQQRDDRILSLEKKSHSNERTLENLQLERQKLLLDLAALRQELERSAATTGFVEDSRHQLEEMLRVEKAASAQLSTDLSTVRDIMKVATGEMEHQSHTIESLQQKLEDAEMMIGHLRDELRVHETSMASKQTEVRALQSTIDSLRTEKAAVERQCDEIMSTLDSTQSEMQQKYAALQATVAGFERDIEERQEELSATQTACRHLEKQRDALIAEMTTTEERVKDLSNENAALTSARDALEEEVKLLRQAHAGAQEVAQQLTIITASRDALEQEVQSLRQAHAEAQGMAQRLTVVTTSQSTEIKALEGIVVSAQQTIREQEQSIEHLNGLVDESKSLHEDQANRLETLESENKSLQTMAKETAKRITTLREVIQTLENALKMAETREEEHRTVVKVYESRVTERDTQLQGLQKQFNDMSSKLVDHRAHYDKQIDGYRVEHGKQEKVILQLSQALDEKTKELEALHLHISELLQATSSPVKVDSTSTVDNLTAVSRQLPMAEEEDTEADKENVSVARSNHESPPNTLKDRVKRSPPATSATGSPLAVDVWYTTEGQWHDQMLSLSLNMHEVLSYVFFLLQQLEQKGDVLGLAVPESIKLWTTHKLRVEVLQEELQAVKGSTASAVSDDEDDREVMRASITSEYISERINRWMKSVETYEQAQQTQIEPARRPTVDSTTAPAVVSGTHATSSKMESQDMLRATEDWMRSPPRASIPVSHTPERTPGATHQNRSTNRRSHAKDGTASETFDHSLNLSTSMNMSSSSPLRFDQVLQDDSLESSDVWNISADESSSSFLGHPSEVRELSFSSALEK
eukprot:gene3176-2334_t